MADLVKLKEDLIPTVEGLGYELVDLSYTKMFGAMTLTLYIYKNGGVGLDDCEAVHKAADLKLDELDPFAQAYNLNVSSLGLDRPIVTDDDFRRNAGVEIEVFLKLPVNKLTVVSGVLAGYEEDFITLTRKNGDMKIDRENISKARPFIKW
ncbi:MAG: ribosome maturation factor RimP [Clostridiaceae bacterium]|jgi:ribosome maturation factor RimP|nr:ribosome maturation factor RimP [Clostridiaceae bacterium]